MLLHSWVRAGRFPRPWARAIPLCSSTRMSSAVAEARGVHAQKVAIITGSTEGIGFAIARRLAQDGAHVVLSSRQQQNVDRAVKELRTENLSVSGVVCHVGKEEDRERLVETALEQYGGIDYLVCNAAVNPFVKNIMDSTGAIWDKIFDVNVKSTFLMVKLAVPHMQKRGGGSIVLTSSISGYVPTQPITPYCVSKTALFSLTKALAPALSPMNIRVNCMAPGLIRTKFSGMIWQNKEWTDDIMKNNNLVRLGEPKDCSGVVSFLCSPDASYITSETIVVAGGAISRL